MHTPPRYPELAACILRDAIRRGEFTLASGKTSNIYCDGRMVSLGKGALVLSTAIMHALEDVDFAAIGGMEMGAIPMVSGVQMRYLMQGRALLAFVVRKAVKGHGTGKRIEGPLPTAPTRVVMLEDSVTTAGSLVDAINVVREAGHTVVRAISMVDRGEGGVEALAALGIDYVPLVTFAELGLDNAT
ncbi:MAG: orotate phosphoribosyltransferase [Phycisphaerales bacterium]